MHRAQPIPRQAPAASRSPLSSSNRGARVACSCWPKEELRAAVSVLPVHGGNALGRLAGCARVWLHHLGPVWHGLVPGEFVDAAPHLRGDAHVQRHVPGACCSSRGASSPLRRPSGTRSSPMSSRRRSTSSSCTRRHCEALHLPEACVPHTLTATPQPSPESLAVLQHISPR